MQRRKIIKKSSLNRLDKGKKKADKKVEIFGVPVFGTQKKEVLRKIGLQRKEMLHVATVNSEYVMEARRQREFKEILAHSWTIVDSWGVVWALKILYNQSVERISGVELVEEILMRANRLGEKVFLLGAQLGIAEKAAATMVREYPEIKFMWYEGARTVAVELAEEASMTIAKINGFEPDYLLVAYGSPWQDSWIEENRSYLRVRVAMGVGGVLDEWAGVVKKCPKWLDQLGLKWAWRVWHEPWRWRRVAKVFQFGALVMYHKLID
ncbi:MAG: hypothetical protein ACD_40C00096G0002 [uncultured bacterium]|nr:MAG: hypothetical protein ACD_40C00096G0002 [uncultured bacterium]